MTHPRLHPLVEVVAQQPTLAEAVAAVIELGPSLAEQTVRTQSTLPVISHVPDGAGGRELEDWPDGLSVMLRIVRPTLEPSLYFGWRGADQVDDIHVDYMFGRPGTDGRRQLAAYESSTLVHARIFRAMHHTIYER